MPSPKKEHAPKPDKAPFYQHVHGHGLSNTPNPVRLSAARRVEKPTLPGLYEAK